MEKKYREGQFVWRELMTTDVAKAKAFYGELLGWTFADMPIEHGTYTIVKKGDTNVAGMMAFPEQGPPPAWVSYASTTDVDRCLAAAKENGGGVILPATNAAGVGRFAIMTDSTGGALGLLCSEEGDMPPIMRPETGMFCWESLSTTDIEKAKSFFGAVLGWTTVDGPGGSTVVKAGEAMVADFGKSPPGAPSHWIQHVIIPNLETSRAQAEKLGATVVVPEIKVPTVGRMAFVKDPTGAMISLFEPDMSGMPAA
ncbi:MAG: VOC family protein [Polyangiaceae bacterium]